jgi:hypothetical protein
MNNINTDNKSNSSFSSVNQDEFQKILKERDSEIRSSYSDSDKSDIESQIKNFDAKKFNIGFEKEKEISQKINKTLEDNTLDELNKKIDKSKQLSQLSIGEIFIGIKDAWFGLLDDIISGDFGFAMFTKNHRLFYFGVTLCIIVLVLYIYDMIMDDRKSKANTSVSNNGIKEVHHIYHVVKPGDPLPDFITTTPNIIKK